MFKLLSFLRTNLITFLEETGRLTKIFFSTILWIFRPPLNLRHILYQIELVGINSLPLVLITGFFTGGVLALQTSIGFRRFGAETMVGTVVALTMTRELGPVLSGLMVSGRVGSAMAAELGSMKVTEQIDALYTLAVNPIKFLIVPRFIASIIIMPILVLFSDIIGIFGGYLVTVFILKGNSTIYLRRTWDLLEIDDVGCGLLKAVVFGMLFSIISCYTGFFTEGGASGVGKATTKAVVLSSLSILISNYFITAMLF